MSRKRLAVLALGSALIAPPAALAGEPLGMAGRWTLDLSRSAFNEAVTGPAPTAGEINVTKDDGTSVAWTLIEEDQGELVAWQFAEAVLDGPPARAVVQNRIVSVRVRRESPTAALIITGAPSAPIQSIRAFLADKDTLVLDETIAGGNSPITQHLTFVRAR